MELFPPRPPAKPVPLSTVLPAPPFVPMLICDRPALPPPAPHVVLLNVVSPPSLPLLPPEFAVCVIAAPPTPTTNANEPERFRPVASKYPPPPPPVAPQPAPLVLELQPPLAPAPMHST